MHRVLLREVVIDVPSHLLVPTRDFWAAALDGTPHTDETYPEFHALDRAASTALVGVQDIGMSTPRVHVDIESDDVDAEVARLVGLGATEVARHGTWVVLRDPAGLLFCVVRVESPDFAQRSREIR